MKEKEKRLMNGEYRNEEKKREKEERRIRESWKEGSDMHEEKRRAKSKIKWRKINGTRNRIGMEVRKCQEQKKKHRIQRKRWNEQRNQKQDDRKENEGKGRREVM